VAGVVEDGHQPGTRLVEGFGIVPDQGLAQAAGLLFGVFEVTQ
jgi:hypothetical protein